MEIEMGMVEFFERVVGVLYLVYAILGPVVAGWDELRGLMDEWRDVIEGLAREALHR